MTPLHIIFLVFVTVPFIEIYLLLQIGGIVGVLPTIALVVGTAILGAGLLRHQGLATWVSFQENMAKGELPIEIVEGPILLMGGALLLTPGFFTDVIGFACLIPAVRKRIALKVIENRLSAAAGFSTATQESSKPVIEGEFKKEAE